MSQQNLEILGNKWLTLSSVESDDFGLIFPENSIFPRNPIAPEDSISPRNPIGPEDPIGPGPDTPIGPDPIDPGPIDPGPIDPGPIDPGPIDPGPIDPGPIDPGPIDPGPGNPGPGNPIDPGPGNPIDPGPGNPIGSDPLTGNPPPNDNRVTALYNAKLDITVSTGIPDHVLVIATVNVELGKYLRNLVRNDFVDIFLQSSVWGIDGNILNGDNDNLFYFPDQEVTGEGTYTFSKIVHRSALDEDHSFLNNDDEISASISLVSFEPSIPLNIQTMTPIVGGKY